MRERFADLRFGLWRSARMRNTILSDYPAIPFCDDFGRMPPPRRRDPTYSIEACFETFTFPTVTPDQRDRIAAAARRTVALRDEWLNPAAVVHR